MLPQLLSLVLLVGLTATSLLFCFERWGWRRAWAAHRPAWLGPRCEFCAGYWLCVLLFLPVIAAYLKLSQLGVTAKTLDISFLFQATPLYARLLLGIELPPWTRLLAAFPVALPAAAVCRVLLGLSGGR
ncbi:hypothetical protein [Hymenobacter ruricola]|uniref:DUF2752 domain-containing protein n=1 Tax=Hymenobacter ruricola TaxID=2791023 RepID=A0ABS0I7U0_9BACT|nr:hypothetical protein [Hymenobacter ruricola]MBF9223023.1 hypothetical protein [Hymenobacter ruricola]